MERFDLGYNRSDELTSAVLRNDATNATLKQFFYSYDPAANRTSEQIDTAVTSGTYNSLNQLTAISAGGKTRFQGTLNEPGTVTVGGQPAWMQGGTNFVADVGLTSGTNSVAVVAKDANNNTKTNTYQVIVPGGTGKSLSYDLAGNTISDGTHTFTWDAASRLVKITYGDGSTSDFGYDAFGRRVKIVEKDNAGNATSTKQFVFDGLEIAEQRDGNNVLTARYFPDGYVTGANATPYEAEQFYYLRDHLGSVRGVFNRDEQAIEVYQDFGHYGRMTLTEGTNNIASDMSYTGHYRHSKSGMYLTRYRAYSPELARWLSRDPIGEAGGINLYGYVLNNPVNWVDPLGLVRWTQVAGGSLAVLGSVALIGVAAVAAAPVVVVGAGVAGAIGLGLGITNIVSGAIEGPSNVPYGVCELSGYLGDRLAQPSLGHEEFGVGQQTGRIGDLLGVAGFRTLGQWQYRQGIPGSIRSAAQGVRSAAKESVNRARLSPGPSIPNN